MHITDPIAQKFSSDLKRKLGRHIKGIFLFGSRARGDAKATSDYDFLVLVDERNKETVRIVRETEVELLDNEEVLSGSLILTEEEWGERKALPIGINILREGIPL
jgi:predicted nucleotidyltransferase